MPIGDEYPLRSSLPEESVVSFNLTGAGAAIMTKPATGAGRGYTSNTRQAVGRYTVFLRDVGSFVSMFHGFTHTAATVAPQVWKYVPGSLNQAAKSIQVECWDFATPSLADPPAASLVDFFIGFGQNPVP